MTSEKVLNLASFNKPKAVSYPIKALICDFSGDTIVVARLHELGLKAGLQISIEGRAPFGGAFLVRFGSTAIALRSEEALCTQIQLL